MGFADKRALTAIDQESAFNYAKYKFVMALITESDMATLFDGDGMPETAEQPEQQTPSQDGLNGPTPQLPGNFDYYISQHTKPFPPEAIWHRQTVTIVRSGRDSQYVGQLANTGEEGMPVNMDAFAAMQEVIKRTNANYMVDYKSEMPKASFL
eukprot:5591911-Amphidinium_carterae.6